VIDAVLEIEVGIVAAPGQTFGKIRLQSAARDVVLLEVD